MFDAEKWRKAWFAKSPDPPKCGRMVEGWLSCLDYNVPEGSYLIFGRRIYMYIAVYGTGIASSQATLSFSMFRSKSPFHHPSAYWQVTWVREPGLPVCQRETGDYSVYYWNYHFECSCACVLIRQAETQTYHIVGIFRGRKLRDLVEK